MMSVEETREVSEIKAKMFLARQFPRNEDYCLNRILRECQNAKLAEAAQYSYPKGGQEVRGASIRLVEVVSRHWGNLISGVKEISRSDKGCTVKAYAWDLETNTADEKVFDIAFTRNTKKGSYAVTDEREKYELMANYATRRKRACLQAVIPGYIMDEALKACEETLAESLSKGGKTIEEVRQSSLEAFVAIAEWITPEMLGAVVGKDFDKTGKQDMVKLKNLYNAIKDGFAKPEIVFGLEDEARASLPSEDEEAAASALLEQMGINHGTNN